MSIHAVSIRCRGGLQILWLLLKGWSACEVSGSASAPFVSTPISAGDSIHVGGLGSSSVSSNVGPMAGGGSSLGPGVA